MSNVSDLTIARMIMLHSVWKDYHFLYLISFGPTHMTRTVALYVSKDMYYVHETSYQIKLVSPTGATKICCMHSSHQRTGTSGPPDAVQVQLL